MSDRERQLQAEIDADGVELAEALTTIAYWEKRAVELRADLAASVVRAERAEQERDDAHIQNGTTWEAAVAATLVDATTRGNTYRARALVLAEKCKRERETSINWESTINTLQAEGIRKWKARAEKARAEKAESRLREADALLTALQNIAAECQRAESERDAASAALRGVRESLGEEFVWQSLGDDGEATCPECGFEEKHLSTCTRGRAFAALADESEGKR